MPIEPNFGPPASQAAAPAEVKQETSVDLDLANIGAPVGAKTEAAPIKEVAKEEAPKKEEPKSSKRKYNLTVDGKNEDLELDLDNDEEVKKYLQKARGADKKFSEAADVRKAAMEFIEQLKKNPRKVLSDPNIGVDVRKFAEDILNEEIKELEKSPEQREKEKLQRELEDLRQQAKDRDERQELEKFERIQAEQERYLENEISTALDVGGMPKTARTVKHMAEMMMIALENNIDLSPRDIAPLIKNTTLSEFKEVVNSLSDDQLEDFLGKEVLGRLRKKNIAKAKAVQTASNIKPTGNDIKKTEAKPASKMTIRQFLKV